MADEGEQSNRADQIDEESAAETEERSDSDNESGDEEESKAEEPNPRTEETTQVRVTRSGRISRAPVKLTLAQHHLLNTQAHDKRRVEYSSVDTARVIADHVSYSGNVTESEGQNCPSVRSILQSHERPGEVWSEGREASTYKEMKQLHERVVFKPINVAESTCDGKLNIFGGKEG